jgi:hypothetical protein
MPSSHSLLRFIAIGVEVCDTGDNDKVEVDVFWG